MAYTTILSIAADCAPHADVLDAVRMVLADDALAKENSND